MDVIGGVIRLVAVWVFTAAVCTVACVAFVIGLGERAWLAIPLFWSRWSLRIIGVELDVMGAEHAAEVAVYVSNHRSTIDALIFPALMPPQTRYLAKAEIVYVPFFGWALSLLGAFLVDRRNTEKAVASIEKGLQRLPADWSIFVAPEGTRSGDVKMGLFKKGAVHIAIQRKLPIVPIGTDWDPALYGRRVWFPRRGTVYVTIGSPVRTDDWDVENVDDYVGLIRDEVAACVEASCQRRQAGAQSISRP